MIKMLDVFDIVAISKIIKGEELEQFTEMYLSNLSSWKCFGDIDQGIITGMICIHISKDSPEFFILYEYGTNLFEVINYITAELEPKGYSRYLRRQDCDTADLWQAGPRFDYTTDYIVPAKKKCLFSKHWYILYDSTLAEKDTAVKTAVLKAEFKSNPYVGNI
jgi:hypothetical protein